MVVKSFIAQPKRMDPASSGMLRRNFLRGIIFTSAGGGLAWGLSGCGTGGDSDSVLTDDAKGKRKEGLLKGTKPPAKGKSRKSS